LDISVSLGCDSCGCGMWVVIEGGGGLGFPVPFPVRDFVISNSFDPFLENGSVIFSSFSNSDGGLVVCQIQDDG
uniref:hypothetical protein n=1 Tax=Nostoc sp. CCY0012 TaxID=1056123 RepID=UPI0039C60480